MTNNAHRPAFHLSRSSPRSNYFQRRKIQTIDLSHSLCREILIKSSGLENDEGRALNKSKSLAEIARTFKLPEDIEGRNRKAHLKRNFDETGETKEEK